MMNDQTGKKNKQKLRPSQIALFALTLVLAVFFLWPVFFAVMSAFKSNGDILKSPVSLPTSLYIKNFQDLFAQSDFVTAIKHMKIFGIYGTLAGPIACYISGSVAFGTLLYGSFLKGVPLEIEEAAQIDGCTPFQTFWQVTFPLLGPCTASMVVLNGLNIWNDFLMPYLALPSNMAKTITVEVYSFVGQYTARWDIVFAGTVCSIVPALLIFILLQKYFVKGITAGAAKG